MSTTDLQGTTSTQSGSPTVVIIAGMPTRLQLVCDDAGAGGNVRVATNAESINQTLSGCVPASGIASPVTNPLGIGTVTLLASTPSSKYFLLPFVRSNV